RAVSKRIESGKCERKQPCPNDPLNIKSTGPADIKMLPRPLPEPQFQRTRPAVAVHHEAGQFPNLLLEFRCVPRYKSTIQHKRPSIKLGPEIILPMPSQDGQRSIHRRRQARASGCATNYKTKVDV